MGEFSSNVEGVLAVLPSVALACTPVLFNKIQLAVEFWVEDDVVVVGGLDFFLQLTSLCAEVGLLR